MNIGMLIGACLMASLSPGPAALSTIETSLHHGKGRAFWHTLGLAVGESPHLYLALYGSQWLSLYAPLAMPLITMAGMSYFIYIGVNHLLHPRECLPEAAGMNGSAQKLFLRGAWVNFTNPKTIPFMLVIIQLANVPTDKIIPSTLAIFLFCTLGSEIVVMSFYAFLGDRLRIFLKQAETIRSVDCILGVLWLLLAIALAWRLWHSV